MDARRSALAVGVKVAMAPDNGSTAGAVKRMVMSRRMADLLSSNTLGSLGVPPTGSVNLGQKQSLVVEVEYPGPGRRRRNHFRSPSPSCNWVVMARTFSAGKSAAFAVHPAAHPLRLSTAVDNPAPRRTYADRHQLEFRL